MNETVKQSCCPLILCFICLERHLISSALKCKASSADDPASECRVSRAGAGRAAARQRRGAHLYACGADSLLVLRHSQRPSGDARRRLLLCRLREQKFRGGRKTGEVRLNVKHSIGPYLTFFDRFFLLGSLFIT